MTQPASFDYIIIGAGTAGCLLANRLSADSDRRVLLIEAGGPDTSPWIHIPAGYLKLIGNARLDWCYETEPQPELGGRKLGYARGKTLGGCSSISGMVYMRGHAANYDHWSERGADGWSWRDVFPYFLRHEDYFQRDDGHATGGEWRVEEQRLSWPILDAGLAALEEIGVPCIEDFNTGDNTGASYFKVNQRRGFRVSAATAFLRPIRHRRNLTLLTKGHVLRIGIEKGRARQVQYVRRGKFHCAVAEGEIVLAAGAFGSPHVLELSGIGNPRHLKAAGIEPRHDLEGVGENFIDHLQIRPAFGIENAQTLNTRMARWTGKASIALEYALRRRGPLAMAPSQAGGFLRSSRSPRAPDLHINLQPLSLERLGAPLDTFPAITVSVSNVQPRSRGHVHARNADWRTPPRIDPAYLSAPEDREVAVESLELARRLMRSKAMRPFQPREVRPGGGVDSRKDMLQTMGAIAGTIFHACGTARMGEDEGAVVDPRLKVRGLDGLRVIDASVIPAPISGGLAAPTLMIAERGAEMIRDEAAEVRLRSCAAEPMLCGCA